MWFFAPPSAWTRLPLAEAVVWMWRAIGVEPTKEIAETSGCSRRRSTETLSPFRTLKTPSGRPASASSSAIFRDGDGSFSLGLRMKVLPVAMAIGNIHIGTMAGKLKGVMPATTPTGWRIEATSTRFDTWVESSPLSWTVMPQARSTISRPRATSPSASEWTLPCSAVISSAIASRLASSSARNLKRIVVRCARDEVPQVAKASLAAATAASTSSTEASATRVVTAPVAGSVTGPQLPDVPSTALPPIQWLTVLTVFVMTKCSFRDGGVGR